MQLRSTLFGKHWECVTFRDFIDGKNSIDEVYFYLFCRDALTKTSTMSDPSNYFEMIHYANWEKVLIFLGNLLKKFHRNDFRNVKEKLERASIIVGDKKKIDVAFVLRVLLEIYKIEKKLKFDYLKAFLEAKSRLDHGVITNNYLSPFENFREFFNSNYLDRTEKDLIELYSECYNIGKGNINFEILYMVMQDNGFLIEDFKLLGLNLKGNLIKENRMNKVCYFQMAKLLQKEFKIFDVIKNYADNLGIESVNKQVNQLYLTLESKLFYKHLFSFRSQKGN